MQIGLMVPVFVLGAALGAYAAKKKGVDPNLYIGQDNEAAGSDYWPILDVAGSYAGVAAEAVEGRRLGSSAGL